ncbi:MAG: M12 family metallo-peptidase [Pseudomonadota bacterium]
MGSKSWLMLVLTSALGWSASAQDMRIQFAEKVAIKAAAGHTEFDAYGRRFSLDLQSNDRLLKTLIGNRKVSIDTDRLMRGEVQGAPGSWVRLAKVGGGLEGAIWDGHDLYVVTSKGSIAANLTMPLDGAPSQTVVYRLSDTVGGLPARFCGLDVNLPASKTKSRTGLEQYQSMITELRANAAALTANEQLDISVLADSDFQNNMGQLARDAMLARVNTVDGIFSDQVGVLIVPSELRMVPAAGNPFTSTNPQALLGQLANYRKSTPAVKAAGIAHLMTGKYLDGDTVGIAYLDSLCDATDGVSLSDSETGEFYSALVMAHELGHNFGAPHDGASGSACSATAQSFLMAPELNGSATFSQCSLSHMQDAIARARGVCIAGLHYADLTVDFPPSPLPVSAQTEFGFPITVRSIGSETVTNATLRVELPPQLSYQSAVLVNGSCAVGGSIVTCQFGDVPANESRSVELRLKSSLLGSFTVGGEVAADNDYARYNNVGSTVVGSLSAVDLGIQMTASTTQVFAADVIDFTIDVSSLRTQTAHGGILLLNLGAAAASIESISGGANACAIESGSPWAMRCNLADVPSGATTRVTVRARGGNPGPYLADAWVVLDNDGDSTNNSARLAYSVRAEREIVTTVSTENLLAVIGSTYDVVYTLTSVGRQGATDAVLTVSNPGSAVQSIVPSAGTCTTPGPGMNYACNFGTLGPGVVRTVTVRLRFDTATSTTLVGATDYTNGAVHANTAKFTWVYVNLRIDAQATINWVQQTLEDQTGTGSFDLQSIGIDFAQHVVAILDVPAPIRLVALRPVYNPHGFQCVLLSAQRASCTGSYGVVGQEGALTRVQFDFVSATAVSGTAQLSLTADSDGNAANDATTASIQVNPYIDVGIGQSGANPGVVVMNVGDVTPVNLTLTSGRNPATNVFVSASGENPWYRVDSISVNGADCPRSENDLSEFGNYYCSVGSMPANASYAVIVRYRATQGGAGLGGVTVYASSLNDAAHGNNFVYINARTQQLTDVAVAIAQSTATTTKGSRLRFPLITVTNTGALADDIVVSIPLPGFATVDTISSSGNCAGTTSLQCVFDSIAPGASATIDLQLLTSAEGTFTSNVTMTADNDSTAANNSASVALTVTAAPAAPASGGGSSSGGGGGGGRMEWLALVLLGGLAMRRGTLSRPRELTPRS